MTVKYWGVKLLLIATSAGGSTGSTYFELVVDPLPQASLTLERAAPMRGRLGLQQRAPRNLRRHLARAVWRGTVLIIADLATFGLMRGLLRALRNFAVLGAGVAAALQAVLPPRMLNGWQFASALMAGLVIMGTYGPGDRRRDPRRLFAAVALATALPLWTAIWSRGLDTVLVEYALTVTLVWAGLWAERSTVDRVVAWVRPRARDAASALFVGPADACRTAAASPVFASGLHYQPIGFVDAETPTGPGAVGHIGDFESILAATGVEVVVLAGHLTDEQFGDVVDASLTAGCQVLSVPRDVGAGPVNPATVWRSGQPLVELTAPTLRGGQLVVKRAMDIVGAIVALVLLSPLLLLVAVLVKLDSPGPVLFRQERVGRGGRRFQIIKFRTMVLGAEARRDELLERSIYADSRLFKLARDPRATRLGRWLRRSSLDELPQFVNVLLGDMSLVGPRPPLPSEVALYERHHYARFDVKPGITGPWQVSGRNQVTDFEAVVRLEQDYIQGWNLTRDLAILLQTVPAVLRMRGAL